MGPPPAASNRGRCRCGSRHLFSWPSSGYLLPHFCRGGLNADVRTSSICMRLIRHPLGRTSTTMIMMELAKSWLVHWSGWVGGLFEWVGGWVVAILPVYEQLSFHSTIIEFWRRMNGWSLVDFGTFFGELPLGLDCCCYEQLWGCSRASFGMGLKNNTRILWEWYGWSYSTKVRVLLTGYKLNGARATSVVEWGGTRQGIHSNPGLLQLILHDNQSVGVREDWVHPWNQNWVPRRSLQQSECPENQLTFNIDTLECSLAVWVGYERITAIYIDCFVWFNNVQPLESVLETRWKFNRSDQTGTPEPTTTCQLEVVGLSSRE